MPLVIERVIHLAEPVLEQLLAIKRVRRSHAALGIDPDDIVIPDRVIDLHPQVLLGLAVEIEERESAFLGNRQRIEHMISALNGKVGLDATRLPEGHLRSLGRIQLRLDMGVGDKEKAERLGGWSGEKRRRRSSSSTGCSD